MRSLGIACILLALGFGFIAALSAEQSDKGLTQEVADGGATPTGDFYLLAIAIDDYVHWPKLRSPVVDAEALVKVLVDQYGLAPQHVTKLYNARATEKEIIGALRTAVTALRPEDALVIYYSGHGYIDDVTDVGAWIPVDAAIDDPSVWIDHSKIKTYMKKMRAKHVLLISDSCFAGDFFSGQKGAPRITDAYICRAFRKTSREAITSGGLEAVQDTGFGEHSVFAHFLVKALRENTSPYLLPSEIHHRMKGGVAANAPQQPIWGPINETGNEPGGSFVFFRKGRGSVHDLNRMIEQQQARETTRDKEGEAAKLRELEKRLAELEAQKATSVSETKAAREREAKAERDREYRAALATLKSLEGYRPRLAVIAFRTGCYIKEVSEDYFVYHYSQEEMRESWNGTRFVHWIGDVWFRYAAISNVEYKANIPMIIGPPEVRVSARAFKCEVTEGKPVEPGALFTNIQIWLRHKSEGPNVIQALEVLRKGR